VKKLLAALDFSEVTDAVVDQAAELAQAFSAELTLIHVAAPDPDFVGFEAGPDTVRDTRAGELRGEHRKLQELADGLRERGIATKALLIQGRTIEKILEEAARSGAGTIVIGSHGHGALHRVLLGSVSEGVVRGAACPVHVVPAGRD
jgi:nucleotide-binding universal stress UspA family protein